MESIVYKENLQKSINKISLLAEEEQKKLQEIIQQLENINKDYQTNNTTDLDLTKIDINNKKKLLINNRKKYIYILQNTINSYEQAAEQSIKIFKEGDL